MSSKPFEITESLSTEEINPANPDLIARIFANSRINQKHIFDFILGQLEELQIIDNPEQRVIKAQKIKLIILKVRDLELNLIEDDYPNGYPDEYKVPALQERTIEEPDTTEEEKPYDYAKIIPGKKGRDKRYIN